jgi:hypothetical protein
MNDYNKRHKTKKVMNNWEYLNAISPGSEQKHKIASIALYVSLVLIGDIASVLVLQSWVPGLIFLAVVVCYCIYSFSLTGNKRIK